ncbi:NF038143 family protein [Thermodesulfobacteriota bacterium]
MLNLDAKYKCILANERAWAAYLAGSVKKQRPISVWEVIMPLLLIFNFMRRRVDTDMFIQNFLFTKSLSLEAALRMKKDVCSREEAFAPIEAETRKLLTSLDDDVYSVSVRHKQLKEMDLLFEHYRKLLGADGKDYAALVIDAYKTYEDYVGFLKQLKDTEKAVNLTSLETVGSRGDPEFVALIEEKTDSWRMASAQEIFGESDP